MSDDPVKPPRFPFIAAMLCVACLGAAAWTWMRYSYAWEVSPGEVICDGERAWPDVAYVRVRGRMTGVEGTYALVVDGSEALELWPPAPVTPLGPFPHEEKRTGSGSARAFVGRLTPTVGDRGSPLVPNDIDPESLPKTRVFLDTTASRFTGASIAGLVVGAMGIFVFTVALRHWLGQRRKFREDTRGHNTSVEADTL